MRHCQYNNEKPTETTNRSNMKKKSNYDKVIVSRVSQKHLDMLHKLKDRFAINISQLMRNTIEKEYKKRSKK